MTIFSAPIARALLDRALDDIARHALPARLFDRGEKTRIPVGIGPPSLAATRISLTSLPR